MGISLPDSTYCPWEVTNIRTRTTRLSNNEKKMLNPFYLNSHRLALVDRVTWYMLLVGVDRYAVEFIESCESVSDTMSIKR